jgi:hypothetical protein
MPRPWLKLEPHFIEVPLTHADLAYGEEIGRSRSDANGEHVDGIIDPHRMPVDIDIQGAIAELAFTKYYGAPWTGRLWTRAEWEQRRQEGDVGPVQIKSVRALHHKMILQSSQRHVFDCPYVLVSLHKLPIAVMSGWCMSTFAMQPRFMNPTLPKRAWAVPRTALCPMATFDLSRFPRGAS